MTGADRIAISDKALRWQIADQARRDLRKAWVDRIAARSAPAVITKARKAYISAAMSCGGHKRGLLTMCAKVNARGVDRPK
jgi:hypothetical protein